jgi:hypothetical protein
LTPRDVVTPQELFMRPDGDVAALLRVYLRVEKREEMYLAYFDPAGTLKKIVQFPHFNFAKFQPDNDSFLDKDGYLWALNGGKVSDVYGPAGDLVQSLPHHGSYVDPNGHLYVSGKNPLTRYGRMGEKAGEFFYAGHSRSYEPGYIQGVNGAGFLYSWRQVDEIRKGKIIILPRILEFYRPDVEHGKLEYVGAATLPPSRYRNPDPRSDYVERTELYEDRLIFDDAGNVYFLGRSPKECWIERVHLEIK